MIVELLEGDMSVPEAKQRRARQLGALTRLRRQAFVLIDSRGSRSRLTSILSDLNDALGKLEELNDDYSALLTSEEDKKEAQQYLVSAEGQHEEAVNRIEEYLKSRKDEPASVVSGPVSHASAGSSASREAEIAARVKMLEVSQLEHRLEMERQEQQIKRERRLQEAKDAAAAADLQVRLTKAAEDELSWERRDDFATDEAVPHEQEPATQTQVRRDVSNPLPQSVPQPSQDQRQGQPSSLFQRSLPKLSLPKFDGNTQEWVRWFALFKTMVHDQPSLSSTEKMAHLQASVTGLAQQHIKGMLCSGDLYDEAIKVLNDRFGREQDIVDANLREIFSCPSPSYLDPTSLERFQSSLNCAITVFRSMGYEGDLQSCENLRRVVQKLPPEMKKEWSEAGAPSVLWAASGGLKMTSWE